MNDDSTSGCNRGAAVQRGGCGAADVDTFEVIEGLQAQIDDLTRTVERHQAILERLTSARGQWKEV